jgi:uncharacterized tellurite resistance protein B-like protein
LEKNMKVADRILIITDLLVGALYADQAMTGEEDEAARRLLADLLCTTVGELPGHVDERIRAFRAESFDLGASARAFLEDPPMAKRRLLELVSQMAHADGVLDLSEDQFLRDLAQHLGMEPAEYEDLVLDYEIEELRLSFNELRGKPQSSVPPPVPQTG